MTTRTPQRAADAAGSRDAVELSQPPGQLRVFMALLRRDLYVTGRELPTFLAQVILQPLFMLFVFGRVLGDLGFIQQGYANLLFPGILAMTTIMTALQTITFPLVMEFGWTKEIEDRLLAPVRTGLVAVEKVVYSSLRAMVAAAVMVPVGILVLGSIPWQWAGLPMFVVTVILAALVGSAIGLTLGTFVPPTRIQIVFALVLVPIMFTGSAQYPWAQLGGLRWFQVVTACNPLTYASEGVRSALLPSVDHIPQWICLVVLFGSACLFTWIGSIGFRRRAID